MAKLNEKNEIVELERGDLLTTYDIAELMEVSIPTVYYWVNAGKIAMVNLTQDKGKSFYVMSKGDFAQFKDNYLVRDYRGARTKNG